MGWKGDYKRLHHDDDGDHHDDGDDGTVLYPDCVGSNTNLHMSQNFIELCTKKKNACKIVKIEVYIIY